MKVSFYHEEPFKISESVSALVSNRDLTLDIALTNQNYEQVLRLKELGAKINVWPVFPKFQNLLLSQFSGQYWITKENIKNMDFFINAARQLDSEYMIIDLEVLPIWKNQFGNGLVELVDKLHENGIQAKVTTIPMTPLEIVPLNADIIAMQTYSHLSYWTNNPKHRLELILRDYESLCQKFPKRKVGMDIGGLSLDAFPGSRSLLRKYVRTIEHELNFCKELGIENVSVYDLKGAIENNLFT